MARAGEEVGTEVERADRGDQVYRRLRELIVRGRLAPGTRVIETEVASRLGVSRTPVRSALQRLEQEGYITTPGNGRQRRPWVAPLTQEDGQELFEIVAELEGLAARRAAGLAREDRSRLVAELERVNGELHEAASAARPDQNRIFDLDTQFHHTYVIAGAGPRLLALHESIKPQAERYIRLYISALVGEIEVSEQEHDATIRAIAEGAPDRAQVAAQVNWRNAADRLRRVIEEVGERGSW